MSIRVGLTKHGSSFQNINFVESETLVARAKDSLKLTNTINRLKLNLYYSLSLNIYDCLICQIYQ